MRKKRQHKNDFDDLDFVYDEAFDAEEFIDSMEGVAARRKPRREARRRIEEYMEDKRLRDDLADWLEQASAEEDQPIH